MIRIFNIISQFTGHAIILDITDHAMLGSNRAGKQGRMSDKGLGIGVLVMGVCVNGALFQKKTKSAITETLSITVEQISPKPVNGDL